jgi:ABC-type amino acid transport substrate-binding protein
VSAHYGQRGRFRAHAQVRIYGQLLQGTGCLCGADGQVIAASREAESNTALPVPSFQLSDEEKVFIASLPTLKISNEMDWPPFDYALGGKPRGYSVDVLRMIGKMTGLDFQFVNGLSWSDLVEQFKAGEIDLLQSVLLTEKNATWGQASRSYARLPYSFITQTGEPAISRVTELSGRKLAIPAGWSIIPVIRERFPAVDIVEAGSTLNAIEMVLNGSVDAALEALTASDRPYKKAKPISVAIDILHKMVLDEHLDQHCFELFVRNKVYLEYANQFLDPSQIDAVDESKYLQVG